VSEIRLNVTLEVSEGDEGAARLALDTLVAAVRKNEDPAQTLQYDACISGDGRTVLMMERYASGDALGAHMQNVGDALGAVLAVAKPSSLLVVGEVPPPIKEALDGMGANYLGVEFSRS
jgi:quinol monooxygenase YgiN